MAQLGDPKTAAPGFGAMVVDATHLPLILPTDRLQIGGKAVPEIRAELRRIPNWRSALAVVAVVSEPVVIIAGAAWLSHPLVWFVAFLLMGRQYARLTSLGHEAVHRTLFSNKVLNDRVGKWLLSYPAWVPFEDYRRAHINHHRDEMGPDEPDLALYRAYPVSAASMRRKLIRDATGQTGWKLLKGLGRGVRKRRPAALKIVGCQLVLVATV